MKSIVTKFTIKTVLSAILLLSVYHATAQSDDSRIRIALNGGWGYHIAKTASGLSQSEKDYINKLRSGFVYGGDVMYFFGKNWGVGVKFSRFSKGVSVGANGNISGFSETTKSTNFIGATFGGRVNNSSETGALILGISLGYLGYTEEGTYLSLPYQMTGGTVGAVTEIGYDFKVSDHIALGAQLSYLSGTLRRAHYIVVADNRDETSSLEDGQAEGLSRIELSAGIRFNF
ncbi:Outer membrane protein beta-barrel domain-containing protein [Filimonas lacunae]|uniref:Outer membrane protein beta-barrel domain-containing protein n=1 Tax=Filimonas lacunae TaxID=477680 RepID=A0A173MAP3_9BACT|nr:outer membrane beta-barrel protein [Filimonas lacunae]BAV04602.1 hypothetical protein FLA_0594 [Filimonas lacunae]SIT32689.1 Outer membrane protein beta-barrel domain-containing protein [Filimonas lacunae]